MDRALDRSLDDILADRKQVCFFLLSIPAPDRNDSKQHAVTR
jgi:hypothetical protein